MCIGDIDSKFKGFGAGGWNPNFGVSFVVWTLYIFSTFTFILVLIKLVIATVGRSLGKVTSKNFNKTRSTILFEYDIQNINKD